MREVLLLELDSPSREELADRRNQPASGLDDLDPSEGARAIRVAEVRIERRPPVRLDEDGRVRALQAGEVADVRLTAEHVGRAGDEERLVDERGEPGDSAHLRPATMYSIASR